jgi:hypothetical protein
MYMAGDLLDQRQAAEFIFGHAHEVITDMQRKLEQATGCIEFHDHNGTLAKLAGVSNQITHVTTMMLVLRDFIVKAS